MRYVVIGGLRLWAVVAAAVVALAIGAAVVDYVVANAQLGPFPSCRAPACFNQDRWIEDAQRRSADIAVRSWVYAAVVLAAVAAATARALRRRPPADRRTIFANLGTAAVVLGIVHALLLWANEDSAIDSHEQPGWTIVALLVVAAAAGGIYSFRDPAAREAPRSAPRWRRLVGYAALGALPLTATTLVLAVIFGEQQPVCGGAETDRAPEWTEILLWSAVGTSLGAAVLVVAGLLARRWFLALVCLVANPVVLLFMIASTCAFY